jgi:hypothetical protein
MPQAATLCMVLKYGAVMSDFSLKSMDNSPYSFDPGRSDAWFLSLTSKLAFNK